MQIEKRSDPPAILGADSAAPDDVCTRLMRALVREWPGLLLCALAIPIVIHGLDRYSLVNGDEEIYHVIARTMVESGDWMRLFFYDQHRIYDTFMNAPIQYWARAAIISVFGSNMWTVRILSALFGVASLLATARLALHVIGDRRAAFLAGLIQLTTLQFIYLHSARTGELEPVIAFLYTLIALLFLRAIESGRSFVGHHVCLVLLLNLKSPTVLIPLLAEGACFALLPAARPALRRFVRLAALILPLGLIWHGLQMIALWEPFVAVMAEMAQQASSHGRAAGPLGRWVNIRFYGMTIFLGAFPYSLAYPLALVGILHDRREPRERLRWLVLALFILAVFVFYILVSKHHRWYIIPTYPLLSVFLAGWLWRLPARRMSWPLLTAVSGLAALLVWIELGLSHFNPFALKAWSIPMKFYWRGWLDLSPGVGVPLSGAAFLAALAGLRARGEAWLAPALAAALGAALLIYGGIRVSLPLRHLDTRSDMAVLRAELDALERSGVQVADPVRPVVPLGWDARFYLGDRYRIVEGRRRSFLLYRKDRPAAGSAAAAPPRVGDAPP